MNLVCFADEKMTISQQKLIISAEKHGVNYSIRCNEGYFGRDFIKWNKDILSVERGCGYWVWKPYLIYRSLLYLNQGEMVFYSDAGIEIIDNLKYIEDQMNKDGADIFLFSGRYKNVEWTKADIIQEINGQQLQITHTQSGPLYSMNGYESFLQVQASNMFFRNTQKARDFVKRWLLYCQMPGFIDDSPSKITNWPGFQENRHDQSILTCLAIRENIKLHWFPSHTNQDKKPDFPGDDYPVLWIHHRRRNEDWQNL